MSNKIGELRVVIADESLGLPERRAAAEHYLAELVEAVPAPAEDDAEVVELSRTWTDDGPLGSLGPLAWKQINLAYGWSESGPTSSQARKRVHDRLRLRALLTVVTDEVAHRLERLEACRVILHSHLHPRGYHRTNAYDAEKLLAKVLPASATKYAGWNKPPVPVCRPPQTLADCW